MQKILHRIKQIDEISPSSRYLIDYSNIKQGLIKYQNNFLKSDQINFFYDNFYTGIPLMLPNACKNFYKSSSNFKINKNLFLKKIFLGNKTYCNEYFKNGDVFSETYKLKKKEYEKIELITKINKNCIELVKKLKKKNKKVIAFQTRNIPHLGHQKIIEEALKQGDYLVINPVIGPKKKGDLNAQTLAKIYNFFSKNFYDNRVFFMPVVANMFYAGPREACHHANIREKLGFDYFLVGRDHAGANNFYKANHAPDIIKKFKKNFTIDIISHYGSYYDAKNKKIILSYRKKISNNYENISGSDFREHLKKKKLYKFANTQLQEYIFDNL
jgi:ATP sulfurylase